MQEGNESEGPHTHPPKCGRRKKLEVVSNITRERKVNKDNLGTPIKSLMRR